MSVPTVQSEGWFASLSTIKLPTSSAPKRTAVQVA